MSLLPLLSLLSCSTPDAPAGPDLLEPADRAARISIALRGVRPTPEELAAVDRDPGALDGLVDEWLTDRRFGDTVRDLHAEVYSLRADTQDVWPAIGALADVDQGQIYNAMQEAPLQLIEHVVTEGLPYTEIVTADYTFTDAIGATIEGLPYTAGGPAWQQSHHVDGRPEAGILSSTGLWQRWWTNQSGKHRDRANLLTKALLCAEIGAQDVAVFPNFDPTDNAATADALATDPACVGCHTDLDPLAAYFWGFELQYFSDSVLQRYQHDGVGYPVPYWNPDAVGTWRYLQLPGPGYYGTAGTDMRDLGQDLVADPRFAPCAVKQAWWYLAQDASHGPVPAHLLDQATDALVSSGYDWREMVRTLVTSNAFLDAGRPPLEIRPEALERNLEAVTGFHWVLRDPRWGAADVLTNSKFGARDLSGGTDQFSIAAPSFSPSPVNLVAWDVAARLAADQAVRERLILDPSATDDAQVRDQLVALVERVTSRRVTTGDPLVGSLFDLWSSARAAPIAVDAGLQPSEQAWALVLRALLDDPTALTY